MDIKIPTPETKTVVIPMTEYLDLINTKFALDLDIIIALMSSSFSTGINKKMYNIDSKDVKKLTIEDAKFIFREHGFDLQQYPNNKFQLIKIYK